MLLGRREGNGNDADVKTHPTLSSSLSYVSAFNHARKGGWKENGCSLHLHIASYSNEGIRRLHLPRMGSLKEKWGINDLCPRKNRPYQAGNRLPPNRMMLASYQVGDSPLWFGIQAVHCAAADEAPAWGWEEQVTKMKVGLIWRWWCCSHSPFYSKQGNPKQFPEATEVTCVIQLWIMSWKTRE